MANILLIVSGSRYKEVNKAGNKLDMKRLFLGKVSILVLIAVLVSIFSFKTLACSPFPQPRFQLKTVSINNCWFGPADKNFNGNTDVVEFIKLGTSLPDSDCGSISLNSEEQVFFNEMISGVKDKDIGFATAVFLKQSKQEFESILAKNKQSEEDECSCRIYSDLERRGEWTFFIDESKATCSIGIADGMECQVVPKKKCAVKVDHFDGSKSVLEENADDTEKSLVPILVVTAIGLSLLFALLFLFTRSRL